MSPFRKKLLSWSIAGAMVGSMAAVVVPQSSLTAAEENAGGCKCDDHYVGSYSCNAWQTACVAGSEECKITCS